VYAYIDIDAPIVQTAKGGGGAHEPSPEHIGMLADMGFSTPQARKALRETVCRLSAVQVPAL
jgi:ubiquitin carboxyl-terminal hydrolase 5/13